MPINSSNYQDRLCYSIMDMKSVHISLVGCGCMIWMLVLLGQIFMSSSLMIKDSDEICLIHV